MKKYYMAYGSNLNIGQMKHRCPTAKVFDTAILDGYKLEFRGSVTGGHLTIAPSKKHNIPVAIWEITEVDEKALDIYEGFPNYYIKEEFSLTTDQKKKVNVMAYVMIQGRDIQLPTGSYLQTCVDGYEQFGFDTFPLYQALSEGVEYKSYKIEQNEKKKK